MAVEFEVWMGEVDEILGRTLGMTHRDLGDAPFRDMFGDECSPEEMVRVLLIDWNDFPEESFDELFGEGYGE